VIPSRKRYWATYIYIYIYIYIYKDVFFFSFFLFLLLLFYMEKDILVLYFPAIVS